jgi:hypothetical protein
MVSFPEVTWPKFCTNFFSFIQCMLYVQPIPSFYTKSSTHCWVKSTNYKSSSLQNFLQFFITSFLVASNIFLGTWFSDIINLCSSFQMWDQDSHSCKIKVEIRFIYLMFSFLDKRWWTEQQQAFPKFKLLLISLWIYYCYSLWDTLNTIMNF